MIAPLSDLVGTKPAVRRGNRVLFVVLVCVLAALPAAGLALTSGAVTHTRPDTLPRPELRGLLCRASTTPALDTPARADGAARVMPAACDLRAAAPASWRAAHAGTALSCRAG
ncbi:hypothetical protein OG968_07720 [Streptomyces althioticus]|uniref:hypothetical protein n=1 Tax=Streptomyces althioticus TaxID=83380 RepID=UPI00387385DE|nr:hypothetical protein OG968_07720 [Streptomyces althioticus]